MKFFTDKTVENDYLLIKIKDYLRMRKKNNDFSQWKEIFIDPGVHELIRSNEYSWINDLNIRDFLDSLPKNHYFSADYPCDMNIQFTQLFLKKSWDNALKYCDHSQYIVTVQSNFNDYFSFMEWFNRYNALSINSEILAIGNICRILNLTEYIKHSLSFAFCKTNHKRIHVYGLAMKNILFAYNLSLKYDISLSMDSTKWTRPITNQLKKRCGISCSKEHRQLYFNTYLEILQSKGIVLENERREM